MEGVVSLNVLRDIRDGDVILVTVKSGLEPEEMDVIRDVLASSLAFDATIIVTPVGFLEGMRHMTLSEMVVLRDTLESAIDSYAQEHAVAEA